MQLLNLKILLAHFTLFTNLNTIFNKRTLSIVGGNQQQSQQLSVAFGCKNQQLPIDYLSFKLSHQETKD